MDNQIADKYGAESNRTCLAEGGEERPPEAEIWLTGRGPHMTRARLFTHSGWHSTSQGMGGRSLSRALGCYLFAAESRYVITGL